MVHNNLCETNKATRRTSRVPQKTTSKPSLILIGQKKTPSNSKLRSLKVTRLYQEQLLFRTQQHLEIKVDCRGGQEGKLLKVANI